MIQEIDIWRFFALPMDNELNEDLRANYIPMSPRGLAAFVNGMVPGECIDIRLLDNEGCPEELYGLCRLEPFDSDIVLFSRYGGLFCTCIDITTCSEDELLDAIEEWADGILKDSACMAFYVSKSRTRLDIQERPVTERQAV